MATLRGSISVNASTPLDIFDWMGGRGRVVGLAVDYALDIHVDGESDPAIVASCGNLIDALDKLRTAALERIRAAELAAIDAASPAEDHEVIGEYTRTVAS
jgi:hypothetical protein